MNNESLKAVCKRILEADGIVNDALLHEVEALYEEALFSHFMHLRNQRMKNVEEGLKNRLSAAPKPAFQDSEDLFSESISAKYGDEVKVLPHPEGPPKPIVEKTIQEDAPLPKSAPVADTPPPTPKAPVEELKKVLEERVVSPASKAKLNNLNIGLNDRIAFVKQLFMGSQEDYQRVISQINTMDDYNESIDFIQSVVKLDYDWSSVEETEQRLLDLVANRFNK